MDGRGLFFAIAVFRGVSIKAIKADMGLFRARLGDKQASDVLHYLFKGKPVFSRERWSQCAVTNQNRQNARKSCILPVV